ncbi:hypothetical protein R1sor_002222 [Riccia sorocarpa]|uniref:RNA exonuclease 4 n=1 Tax=Riccia sorocarpa TaxID=122646 RepID=A0ABD3H1A6_9MARC
MKRKHAVADTATNGVASSSKEPAPLSSNWLQLQAELSKHSKHRKRFKKPETLATAPSSDVEIQNKNAEKFSLQPTSTDTSVTKVLALDCEMVGVGVEGKRSALARVSLVNVYGNVVYDKHVRPPEFVTDFRTRVSGVRPRDLRKAEDFWTVQKEVAELIKGKTLVGHAIHNDLKTLLLSHPRKNLRDTQRYKPLRSSTGRVQALKHLTSEHLGLSIQEREHDSVEDARAALCLYKKFKEDWEKSLRERRQECRTSAGSGEKQPKPTR